MDTDMVIMVKSVNMVTAIIQRKVDFKKHYDIYIEQI
jgi:hypothetical protein